MATEKIILIGGGGHCKSVIDVIEAEGRFEIAGIVDVKEKVGQTVLSYPIIASDEDLEKLSKQYKNFIITLGQIKSSQLRQKFYTILKNLNVTLPVIVDPSSKLSKHACIGEGTVIMHKAFVNAGARIGNNCIINTGSVIEHEVEIGDHCHISTSAVVNGDCRVKNNIFIGSNATIAHGITIEENNVIGAGAVIIRDTEKNGVYVGNPGKPIR